MDFVLISLVMVGFIVLCLVLLARAYPGPIRRLQEELGARSSGALQGLDRLAQATGIRAKAPSPNGTTHIRNAQGPSFSVAGCHGNHRGMARDG